MEQVREECSKVREASSPKKNSRGLDKVFSAIDQVYPNIALLVKRKCRPNELPRDPATQFVKLVESRRFASI
jgi:hypothetical protein